MIQTTKKSNDDRSVGSNDLQDDYDSDSTSEGSEIPGYHIHRVSDHEGQQHGEPRVFMTIITEEEAHKLVVENYDDKVNYNTQIVNYTYRWTKDYTVMVDKHKANPG